MSAYQRIRCYNEILIFVRKQNRVTIRDFNCVDEGREMDSVIAAYLALKFCYFIDKLFIFRCDLFQTHIEKRYRMKYWHLVAFGKLTKNGFLTGKAFAKDASRAVELCGETSAIAFPCLEHGFVANAQEGFVWIENDYGHAHDISYGNSP